MGETVSAEPRQLAAFDAAQSDAAAALLRQSRLLETALTGLARTRSGGLGALPLDLGRRLGAHARHLDDLGRSTGRIGAAFAAAGSGQPGGVVRVDGTLVENLLSLWDSADAAAGQLPDDAPAVVPGANGCPALAVPTWFRLAGRDDQPEAFDEPLWTGLQTYCRPELIPEPETRIAATQTGLITGPGGITIGIGQVVEARGGRGGTRGESGRGQAPTPEPPPRVLPIPPASSPIWRRFRRHQGETRTNGLRGSARRYYDWDYLHGHIEVFNGNDDHLGTMNPLDGTLDTSTANPNHRPRNGR